MTASNPKETTVATWVAKGHAAISRKAPWWDQATWNPTAATATMRTRAFPSSTNAFFPNSREREKWKALEMSGARVPGWNIQPWEAMDRKIEANRIGITTGATIAVNRWAAGTRETFRSSAPGRQVGMALKHSTMRRFRAPVM